MIMPLPIHILAIVSFAILWTLGPMDHAELFSYNIKKHSLCTGRVGCWGEYVANEFFKNTLCSVESCMAVH